MSLVCTSNRLCKILSYLIFNSDSSSSIFPFNTNVLSYCTSCFLITVALAHLITPDKIQLLEVFLLVHGLRGYSPLWSGKHGRVDSRELQGPWNRLTPSSRAHHPRIQNLKNRTTRWKPNVQTQQLVRNISRATVTPTNFSVVLSHW